MRDPETSLSPFSGPKPLFELFPFRWCTLFPSRLSHVICLHFTVHTCGPLYGYRGPTDRWRPSPANLGLFPRTFCRPHKNLRRLVCPGLAHLLDRDIPELEGHEFDAPERSCAVECGAEEGTYVPLCITRSDELHSYKPHLSGLGQLYNSTPWYSATARWALVNWTHP